jgi:Phosphotransferase enzyme family
MMALMDRTVTLVVCDRDGTVLGEIEPFTVDTPWWQDIQPVHRRFPSLAVLRLLSALPEPGTGIGGHVTYLAEIGEGPSAGLSLNRSQVVLDDHPLRMPWARPGGPAADLAWASGLVDRPAPAVQHRTWNLSAIWSIPARGGRVWLKCVPGFFGHEGAVLDLLACSRTPQLIRAAGHRILLRDMSGEDGFAASVEQSRWLIDHLVELQFSTVPRVPEFLAGGVPDARWPTLLRELRALVARRAPHDARLLRTVDGAEARLAAIDECGLPDSLVHGDAHPGNARIGIGTPIWFDWGDSRVGNPLLDLAVLEREPARQHRAV